MRAVVLREFGPPSSLVVEERADPVPGAGQVVIDVELASITFVETQVRAGRPPNPAMTPALPMIPGNGVGGRVAAVGPDVDHALVGRRVVSTTGGSGGYAERVAVDAAGLIHVPDGLPLADAVALLADGRTALGLMQAANVQVGESVLVDAAAGGVGSLLVQLAHAGGARVVALAGGSRKVELAYQLGAERAVDYSESGWAERVAADVDGAGGIDVVFDGVGGAIGEAAFGLVRRGGRFCAFGMASGRFAQISDSTAAEREIRLIRGGPMSPQQMRDLSRAALAEAAAGRLQPVVGQTFPLERAADAHAAIEARATLGKTLLLVRSPTT